MKSHLHPLTALTVLMAFCACSCSHSKQDPSEAVVTDSLPMMVMQIQKCARLYTTEYHIHKIVTHDDMVRLKGKVMNQPFSIPLPLGERKIAIPLDATVKAYIDFSRFSERNIERNGNKITIFLPDPELVLTATKVNQEEVREYVGLVRPHFSDKELSSYEQQGREAILAAVPEMGLLESARANAARVLVPMLTQMGYDEQDIIIAFRKNMDLETIINSSLERK